MGIDITVGIAIVAGGALAVALGALLAKATAAYVLKGIRDELDADLSGALARAVRDVQRSLENKLEEISDRLATADHDRNAIWRTLEELGDERRKG